MFYQEHIEYPNLLAGLAHAYTNWQPQMNLRCRTPLDLGFWSFLTFLHRGIEEVERHLL